MQPTEAVANVEIEPHSQEPAAPLTPDEPAPRSLWSLMSPASPPETTPVAVTEEDLEPFELVEELVTDDIPVEITADAPAEDALGDEFVFESSKGARPPSRGWQALGLGLSALPFAAAAWWGWWWPAMITAGCGFAALILAAAEWTASGPVNHRERRKVTAGALAGGLALLLGPYVFSPLGNAAREAHSGRNTQRHLQRMGAALNQFHEQHAAFPVGGTVTRDEVGRARGGHSWMAAVLPHIGEQSLFDRIDFSHPYDEPVNRPAMSTPVNTYFAAGGDRALNGGGLAVTHFAGVGGEIRSARGTAQAAGIFRAEKSVSRDDVTDGLSTTLAAGEINGPYPAWGDPENWRVPGKGLNKDARGFGNSAQNGATMLFADGHVKFFPNATDPDVLRRLCTRSAGDLTAGVD